MRPPAAERAPRLWRAVGLQLLLLAAGALASDLPWTKRPAPLPEPPKQIEKPKPVEHRLRVLRLPPPEKPPEKVAAAKPAESPKRVAEKAQPKPPEPAAKPPPPKVAAARPPPVARPRPPEPVAEQRRPEPPEPEPEPQPPQPRLAMAQPQKVIAADATAVHGVRLRVLVPSSPAELAAHLRNSGGCMVVSRLAGDGAEVMSLVALRGGGARLDPGSPCDGVPRLVRDGSVNAALGDPLGQARAQHPGESGELVLQVLLTPRLHDQAQLALRQRFGDVSEQEMGEKAAQTGYQLTCFAEPAGTVRCQ